jgi:hypothetical protein
MNQTLPQPKTSIAVDRLPVRPSHFRTEALSGYLLRLNEENGYSSMAAMRKLVQAGTGKVLRETNFSRELLSSVADCSVSDLNAIALTQPMAGHRRSILGQGLTGNELSLGVARCCPQCIRSKGFAETHFQLALMIACPEHGCLLVSSCPNCTRPVGWSRTGLLICQCGQDFSAGPPTMIGNAERSLLDIIRRSALGLAMNAENPHRFPQAHLAHVTLSTLLGLIRTVARSSIIAAGGNKLDDDKQIIAEAAKVLRDWPKNFDNLAIDLGGTRRWKNSDRSDARYQGMVAALDDMYQKHNEQHTVLLNALFLFQEAEQERQIRKSDRKWRRLADGGGRTERGHSRSRS